MPSPSSVMDWGVTPQSGDEENICDNVHMHVEHFQTESLGTLTKRSTARLHEFHSIINAFVINAITHVQHPESDVIIDFEMCPYGAAGENPVYVLELLADPQVAYVEVEREAATGTPTRFRAGKSLLELQNLIDRSPAPGTADNTTGGDTIGAEEPALATPEAETDPAPADQDFPFPPPSPPSPKVNELDHSRPLDVHTWSDHPEVNDFVNRIYADHFKFEGNERIRKKHLKVILLDLYVAWFDDPTLKIAYSRNPNHYEGRNRLNELHISKTAIRIVDRLVECGLVEQRKGFLNRDSGIGRISRMWPTEKLVKMFENAKFGPLDIGEHPDREAIILRNEDGKNILYDDDAETNRMRGVVSAYNNLIRRTFVDIPILKEPYIPLNPNRRKNSRFLYINQRNKFTRRIFNRGSFDKGGRFWGGWWQRCPKEWRENIYLDDKPTQEIDYSGLHIVMLYADAGIDYWKTIGSDPYTLEFPEFDGTPEELRSICKQLVLIALNAENEKKTFSAFRGQAENGSPEKRMTNPELSAILDALREKHHAISDKFANDAGIDLMNQDALITERLIQHFTGKGIPILTIHDSFIVPISVKGELEEQMKQAYAAVKGVPTSKMEAVMGTKGFRTFPTKREKPSLERRLKNDPRLDVLAVGAVAEDFDPPVSRRYQHNLKRFREWLEAEQLSA